MRGQWDWWLAGVAPGAAAPPADSPDWTRIDGPATAAAALRERGLWSLDGPPRDFDAQDWWWRAQFDAPGATAGAVLCADGIATDASAWLNGEQLLAGDNMFTAHRWPVGPLLREQGNALLLQCRSLQAGLARRRPRPRWRAPMVAHQQLRWWRSTLLGRTPGWSPPAAPVGPWRPLRLDADGFSAGLDWHLDVQPEGGGGRVVLRLDGASAARIESARLSLGRSGCDASQPLRATAEGGWTAQVALDTVALWWPHTHGEPALYQAGLDLQLRDGSVRQIALGAVGFRTVTLDTAAGAFRVIVNGVPVFCRGACWTPLDVVSLQATPAQYEGALLQARDAGMNMLRVPGTNVYEDDAFYAACDAAGVLVWQDFMFANMDYPEQDAAWSASAEAEVRQQLHRLQRHPCIAVLCGNSEVEQQAAMWGAAREAWQPAFFHRTLPALCAALAPAIPYWPSSAHGGAFPHVAGEGTTSYYGVGAYRRPLDDARRSGLRFATECLAFANIPGDAALARMPGGLSTRVLHPAWKARSPRDLGAGWDFDEVRDHYLAQLFHVDPVQLRQWDHARYLSLGRLAVAEVMATSFGEWRRAASGCGGALVLFLRDLWAGAGWGLVDEQGGPKSAWHAMRRVLGPQAAWITDEGVNGLDVHVANDGPSPLAARLELALWRDGELPAGSASLRIDLAPHGSARLAAAGLFESCMDLAWAYRFGPPVADTVVATLRDEAGLVLSQALHFPGGIPVAQEADVGLAGRIEPIDGDTAQLVLRTRRLAIGVHADIPGWQAGDAWFHLPPEAERSVRLRRLPDGPARPQGTLHAINARNAFPVAAATD